MKVAGVSVPDRGELVGGIAKPFVPRLQSRDAFVAGRKLTEILSSALDYLFRLGSLSVGALLLARLYRFAADPSVRKTDDREALNAPPDAHAFRS